MRFFLMPSRRYLILRRRTAPPRRTQDVRAAHHLPIHSQALRMRIFVNAINGSPYAEERPRARLEARTMLAQAALIAAALIGGYPLGAGAAEHTPLYYQDPSGKPDYSPTPKKDAAGRDYLPVYDDTGAPPASPPSPAAATAPPGGERKILYYRNPMGLPDTSPVPKKDSMGMDYIPVYEGDDQDDNNTVKVSLDRIQRSGVRIEKVQLRTVVRAIRAPGIVRINERKLSVVTL